MHERLNVSHHEAAIVPPERVMTLGDWIVGVAYGHIPGGAMSLETVRDMQREQIKSLAPAIERCRQAQRRAWRDEDEGVRIDGL